MSYQIFLSPQVEGCVIITYKHGTNELPHGLSNDLKLRILASQNDSLVSNLPAKIKILVILAKNFWKTKNKLFP